jgi:predicted transposase/invertase (TIGR01784 family)
MSKKGKKGSKIDEGLAIFINPRSDFGFKRVLNNPKMLMSFMKVLEIEKKLDYPVEFEKYLLVEHHGESWVERSIIVDIRGQFVTGEHFLIEMQNVEPKNFIERLWYYSIFLVKCQSPPKREKKADKKKWNYDLKSIFVIAIVNFPMVKGKKAEVVNWAQLKYDGSNKTFLNKLNFAIVDLTNFNKTEEELQTDADFWFYTLKYAETLSECPEKMKNHEIFSELYDILRTNKLTPKEMKAYQKHVLTKESVSLFTDRAEEKGLEKGLKKGIKEGLEKGIEKGIEKGREETLKQIIFDAADQGFSVEIIAGITRETVNKVQAVLKSRQKIEP